MSDCQFQDLGEEQTIWSDDGQLPNASSPWPLGPGWREIHRLYRWYLGWYWSCHVPNPWFSDGSGFEHLEGPFPKHDVWCGFLEVGDARGFDSRKGLLGSQVGCQTSTGWFALRMNISFHIYSVYNNMHKNKRVWLKILHWSWTSKHIREWGIHNKKLQ